MKIKTQKGMMRHNMFQIKGMVMCILYINLDWMNYKLHKKNYNTTLYLLNKNIQHYFNF